MANQPKKYKKFVATAATATLVASAIVPVASAKSFSDVAETSEFQPFIDSLSDAGIINGYADGTFKPGNKLTRGQVVKMLGRWVESNGTEIPSDWNSKQRFNDVPVNSADEELVKYAALVKDAGVFTGSNGNLMASKNITRQQMAKVLNGAYEAVNGTSLVELAEDIDDAFIQDLASSQQEFEGYIQALVDLEISTVSVFRPTENVTRAQFAKFLYNTINLEKVSAYSVNVVNNTTVEVTFPDDIRSISNIDFEIEGLEVKNAVVKQSDKSTAILTTASQEAGKEYTVTVDGEEAGTFIGATAVIPTAIDIVEKTQQQVLGNQVTVTAKVKVAEGQSAEGIPVTFNIINGETNNQQVGSNLNPTLVGEAVTNADGVAVYTYTRYASTARDLITHDEVQAYATGKATVRAFSKVYWGAIQPLTITEVTEGNSITNGGKKVYKVKLAGVSTNVNANNQINGTTLNRSINIGFKENVNVAPDKAVKTIDVIDAGGRTLGYPGQFTTTGAVTTNTFNAVQIPLDANGEATFTLTGSDATVTPFVFKDIYANTNNTDPSQGRFDETELVAYAPAVTFAKQHTLQLTVDSIGTQTASAYNESFATNAGVTALNAKLGANPSYRYNQANGKSLLADDLFNTGGRDYKAVLRDKDGKLAQTGTQVKVSVAYGSARATNNTAPIYLVDNNSLTVYRITDFSKSTAEFNFLTDAKGEISFTLIGGRDSYATPTVFVDSNNPTGLDKNDLQQAGEIVYFGDRRIVTATLTIDGKETTNAQVTGVAKFAYQTVDQNNKPYAIPSNTVQDTQSNVIVTSFEVKTGFAVAYVYADAARTQLLGEVRQDGTRTFTVNSANGKAEIYVVSAVGNTVTVNASASHGTYPNKTASATFTNQFNEGVNTYVRGRVVAIDSVNNRVLLSDSTGSSVYELSYGGATQDLQIKGQLVSEATFERNLQVGEELHFTQATENTKASFNNYDFTSGVALSSNVRIVINGDQTSLPKHYDFGVYNAASNPVNGDAGTLAGRQTIAIKELVINGDNIKVSNLNLNGDLVVGVIDPASIYTVPQVLNDFAINNSNVTGTTTVNRGDGNTLTVTDSTLNKVDLKIKEHVVLSNSTINEIELYVNGSHISGVGTVTAVTTANGSTFSHDATVIVTNGSATTPSAALTAAKAAAAALKASDYTAVSYKAVTDAVAAADALSTTATDAEKAAAAKAITDAIAALVKAPEAPTGVEVTKFTANTANDITEALGIYTSYAVEGTVADATITSVELIYTLEDGTKVPARTVTVTNGKFTDALPATTGTVKSVKAKVGTKETADKPVSVVKPQ